MILMFTMLVFFIFSVLSNSNDPIFMGFRATSGTLFLWSFCKLVLTDFTPKN